MNEKDQSKEEKTEDFFEKIDKFWKISAYFSGVFIALFIILDGLIFTNTFDFPYATWKDFYVNSFDLKVLEFSLYLIILFSFVGILFISIIHVILWRLNSMDNQLSKRNIFTLLVIFIVLLCILCFIFNISPFSFIFNFIVAIIITTIIVFFIIYVLKKIIIDNFIKNIILMLIIILSIVLISYQLNKQQWQYNFKQQKNNFYFRFEKLSLNLLLNPLYLQHNYKNIDVNISQYDFSNHPYKDCIYENNQTKFLDINSSAFVLSLSQTNKLYFQKDKNGTCIYAIKVNPFKNQEFYKLVDIGYIQKQ